MNAPIAKTNTKGGGSRLGKGLSAIFADEDPLAPESSGQPRTLPIADIFPNRAQPRRHFDDTALAELAASIKEKGVLQPILVRPHPSRPNAYEIVAGERRWRASQVARLHDVPVIVRDIKDQEVLEIALIENIQRADLTPVEEAESFQKLIDGFSYTQEGLGTVLGKSRAYVSNMLRLNALPDTIKEMMKQGSLTAGHARALLSAKNPLSLANEIIMGGLSVRQAENLARLSFVDEEAKADGSSGQNLGQNTQKAAQKNERRGSAGSKARMAAHKAARAKTTQSSADILKLERDVSSWLGLKVKLTQKQAGAGILTINYSNLDQLEDVLKRLSVTPE